MTHRLGWPAVEFPAGHGGFVDQPGPFAQELDRVLTGTS